MMERHLTSLLSVFKSFYPCILAVRSVVALSPRYRLITSHLTVSGFSRHVIESRDKLIRSQIEEHSPNKERYGLVAKVVNVGIALLVYARDERVAKRVRDVQTQWTGCGPMWMGNKGAVGVRFRLVGNDDQDVGETFT